MSGYEKEITDSLYNAFLTTAGVVAIGWGAKKALGMSKPSAKIDTEDVVKLTGYIAASTLAIDYAKKNGWIPPNISPK